MDWEVDEISGQEYLGRYSDTPGPGAIDRLKTGDAEPNQLRYWNPDNHREFNPKNWEDVPGKTKRKVIKQYGSLKNAEAAYRMQDYKRAEALNNGEFHMEGCVVKAWLGEVCGEASLWGIESDSEDAYKKSVEKELKREALADLKSNLEKEERKAK